MSNDDLEGLARELNNRGAGYALVTVVRAVAPTSAYPGAQAIILADGTLRGWIGGGCARDLVIEAAKSAIANGEPKLVRISNEQMFAEDDIEHYTMSCASNGSIELFIQPNNLGNALCVLGTTPAAEEARFLAHRLRIRLTMSPSDAPVVLVATQGQGDEEALEAALRSSAKQVLMIASRRKSDKLRAIMQMRGIDEAQLARLQAPAGPDVGAKTPGEIALVAIAGVLAFLRGRTQQPARTQRGDPGPRLAPSTAKASDDTFINPVCGAAVSVAHALHVETVAGVSYYFCCDGCWTTFRKDPAKYAAIHANSGAATIGTDR
ncbi:MAG TPA: XdhC family protein [Steroidobacteraceae bacterium]|nr:XdhC family protein [Steroidobacteraceae bacterium]